MTSWPQLPWARAQCGVAHTYIHRHTPQPLRGVIGIYFVYWSQHFEYEPIYITMYTGIAQDPPSIGLAHGHLTPTR